MLKDNPALKDSRRTAAIDHPLEDDPWGNALAAGVVGGVAVGARSAAMDALIPIAPRHIVQNVAVGAAKGVAKSEAFVGVTESLNMGPANGPATYTPANEPLASTVERPYLVLAP